MHARVGGRVERHLDVVEGEEAVAEPPQERAEEVVLAVERARVVDGEAEGGAHRQEERHDADAEAGGERTDKRRAEGEQGYGKDNWRYFIGTGSSRVGGGSQAGGGVAALPC